ncbi:diversity-generating retroelement protein Avd [Aliarcobacter cryaerophilus]|uniref:diversity-generating retroelement protein Avd n=1 Tax=Aliarcobacter cryaerophilus TaxID=28198 RepID=UPI0021B68AFD|nr:diversity-generating retroelement protein Avd [Aliarcobacter cryaerophilus]MCT7489134.1 diversity-generating retroelement protein Avd [Aliarcobacter cryaerophilus]
MENRYFLIEKKIKDLISYINIYSKHLPKHEKYVLGEKLRRLSYEILELAITVNKKVFKKTDLTQLNIKHEILRQLVEVSYDLGYVDKVQRYHHLSLLIDELGKMIGSWIKKLPKSGEN